MAVFEKKVQRRNQLDDTEVLTCIVENSQNVQGHTEYVLRIQRGPQPERCWNVSKRYRDFAALNGVLTGSGICLPLPPKRIIGNMDPQFIAGRQAGLQNYLNTVLQHPILSSSLHVKQFLDPVNYSTPFHESALHAVSLALRGEAEWEVLRPLPEIGWRVRKHYFTVRRHTQAHGDKERLLSWVEHGPDMMLEVPQLQAAMSAISALQAPIAINVELFRCSEAGCLIVRRVIDKGSLRDILYGSKPRTTFLRKYCSPKQGSPFSGTNLVHYGRQLLHILAVLHHKGVPYGHLHAGNVCIENGRLMLLDVEGGLLGLPSILRPFIIQHRRLDTLPRIDMYCFGHLMFEMAFGYSLQTSTTEAYLLPAHCPPLLADVFDQLLSPRALREPLPTANELLQHDFFHIPTVVEEPRLPRQALRLSGTAREAMRLVSLKIEERIRCDQKMVHHQRRLARVKEVLGSEEEKRRRKQKWKQREREKQQQQHKEQQCLPNGKSPERSESPLSTSTATSAGTLTPPSGVNDVVGIPPPPIPPQPPSLSLAPGSVISLSNERSALLSSICAFNKTALRNTGTRKDCTSNGGCVFP